MELADANIILRYVLKDNKKLSFRAKKMVENNLSIDLIAEITGLSKEEIEKL